MDSQRGKDCVDLFFLFIKLLYCMLRERRGYKKLYFLNAAFESNHASLTIYRLLVLKPPCFCFNFFFQVVTFAVNSGVNCNTLPFPSAFLYY